MFCIILLLDFRTILDKKFKKELKMIEDALQDERSKRDFKEYTKPLVEYIVDKFITTNRGKKKPFYFADYFTWYVRQGIVEYLKSRGDN